MHRKAIATFGLVLALVAPVPLASAQTVMSTLRGKVTDEQGGVLPGVTVTARQTETNLTRSGVTTEVGQYFLPNLPAGSYEVTAELAGFTSERRSGLVLQVGQENTIDFTMKVGGLQETVNVVSEVALLETTRTTLGSTISKEQINTLPVLNRDFSSLALLAPGVTTGVGGNGASLSFAGQRGYSNAVFVDGASNIWEYYGRQASNFPMDWIQEFQVLTNSFSAEFGTASGGVLNVITRSGSNQFRGRGYAFFRDAALDSPPFAGYFADNRPQYLDKTPPFTQRRWGGVLGGPVLKDRLFFFAGYEDLLRESSDVLGISDYWRNQGYGTIVPVKSTDHPFMVKGDVTLSSDHRFSVRYDRSITKDHNLGGPLNVEESREIFGGPVWNVVSNLTSTLTNTMFNELRVFYGSNMPPILCRKSGTGGFANLRERPGTFAHLVYPGATFGCSVFTGLEGETNLAFIESLSVIRGRHQFKLGGQVNRVKTVVDITNYHDGSWSFPTDIKFDINNPASYPDQFTGNVGAGNYEMPIWKMGLFLQDTWTLRDDLTLNLGVRYDIDNAFAAPNDWVDAKNSKIVASLGGTPPYEKTTIDKNNIAPRLGVVWTPTADKRTTVRAAFGLFYDQNHSNFNGFYMLNDLISTGIISMNANSPLTNPFWNDANTAAGIAALRAFFAKNWPYFPDLSLAPARKFGIGRRDPNLQVPYTMQYTTGVSREIIPNLVVDANFVYARGVSGWIFINQNIKFENGLYITPDARFTTMSRLRNEGWSRYKALQSQMRYRKGSTQAGVSYTLAKTTSNYTTSIFGGGPTNPLDLSEDEGPDNSDRRHNLAINGSYTFPLDIQVGGIFTYRSGQPYSVSTRFQVDADPFADRPEPRNSKRGESATNVDLRVSKTFRLPRNVTISAFWEMFNAFNTSNFVSYAGSLQSPSFGQPLSALEMRRQQLGFNVSF